MKLNNYEKISLSWGIILFIAYFLQHILKDFKLVIIVWSIAIAMALFIQAYLMWVGKGILLKLQLIWILISIAGGILTYFLWSGDISVNIKINAFWLLLTAFGMILTYLFIKKKRYILLSVLYFAFGIIISVYDFQYDLILVGLIFLLLSILDVLLEKYPLIL